MFTTIFLTYSPHLSFICNFNLFVLQNSNQEARNLGQMTKWKMWLWSNVNMNRKTYSKAQYKNLQNARTCTFWNTQVHVIWAFGLLAYDLGTIKYRKYFWSLILLYFIRYTYILILTEDLIRWERNKHLSGQIKHRCWYGILHKSVLPSLQILIILSLIFVSKFHFPNQRLMCSEVLNKLLSSAYKAYCKQYTKC